MGEFKLNEEQTSLANKLFATVNNLIQKYSYMEEAHKFTVSELTVKMKKSDNEDIEEIKAKIENLQSTIVQLRCSLTTLKNIHVYSDGAVPAYTDAFSFLIAVYAYITDIAYELGRVEGYSSGQINAHSDVFSLKYDYNALKDSLISKD